MTTFREDIYQFDAAKWEVGPAGSLRARGRLTRTGTMPYADSDGSIHEEYRDPSEVFHPDSLDSLLGAPLTIEHPSLPVTPQTWREQSVGTVLGSYSSAHDQGVQWLEATVTVQDAKAIELVKKGKLVELSLGYSVDLRENTDPTKPWKYEQTNIRYNHLALLPEGAARAGRGATLRSTRSDSFQPSADLRDGPPDDTLKGTTMSKEEIDALLVAKAKLESERDSLAGKVAALESQVDSLRKDASAEAVEARVAARLALLDTVRAVAPKADTAGKTERELLEIGAGRTDGTDDFLRGVIAVRLDSVKREAESSAKALRAATKARKADSEVEEEEEVEDSEEEAEEKTAADMFAEKMKDVYKNSGFKRSK